MLTHDARRTTHGDGRIPIAIDHQSHLGDLYMKILTRKKVLVRIVCYHQNSTIVYTL